MKFKGLLTTAKQTIVKKSCKAGLVIKKNSPAILVGVGCVGVVVAGVMACKETLKLEPIIDEAKETLQKIDDARNNDLIKEKYSEEDANHDKFVTYSKTAVKVVKNYLPSIGLMALSICCVLASYKIMKKRNVTLMAAYNGLKLSFDKYRERVTKKYGEDVEKMIFSGFDPETKAEKLENDAKNEENSENCNAKDHICSEYAKFFDASSPYWDKSPDYNKTFLIHRQAEWNRRLKWRGHVFLNEIYDDLGLPRTQAGSLVGWIADDPKSDNYIDFGIFRMNTEAGRNFVNGYENVFLLDFNVDGIIYDKIGAKF